MQFRAAVLIVPCAIVGLVAADRQDASKQQAADHAALAGTWQLDEADSKLQAENWRNRQISWNQPGPCLPTLTKPGEPETYDCGQAKLTSNTYNSIGELTLVAFRHALLEAPQTLTIRIDGSSVSIDGRPRDVTTYRVDGQSHRLRMLLTYPGSSAPPSGRHSAPPHTENVDIRTQWIGENLVQELSSNYRSGTTFAMTETFLPTDDGQQLFVMIDVKKLTLKPPVKPIKRVYVRGK